MRVKLALLTLSTAWWLAGCVDPSYEQAKHRRAEIAATSKNGDPIVIGIPWRAADSDDFINGVKLAVNEINQKGGVLDSPLQLLINDGESAFNDPALSAGERQDSILHTANAFAANPYLTAVIGHSTSSIAVLASVIYQNHGILFLAPNATNAKLTEHNFDYTFRAIPTNAETGSQLAAYAAQRGYKHIAMLHGRGDYETELANTFATAAINQHGMNIVYRRSFFNNTLDVMALVTDLKKLQQLDAVFIASNSRISATLYQQSRNMGIKLPFIGGETLDTQVFLAQVEQWENAEGIQNSGIPTVFNVSAPANQAFVRQFKQAYGETAQPDYLAALGYDSVHLLAHGIQRAQSKVPLEIAVALRYMEACHGLAGTYEFKRNGDLKTKPLYFKRLVNGHYVYEQVNPRAPVNAANLEACNDGDRDHDGILNTVDACPATTQEEIARGIIQQGARKGCPIDNDEDGIAAGRDACVQPAGVETAKGVGSAGCPHQTADNRSGS